jgi:uncharacterized metal-binding protein YceD (DUF177 family)
MFRLACRAVFWHPDNLTVHTCSRMDTAMARNRTGDTPDRTASQASANPRIRPADLAQRKPHRFSIVFDASACSDIAGALELSELRKARLDGVLTPAGGKDWDLDGQMGATVVQPCVATLAPVTTRIDEPVVRRYRAKMPDEDQASEIEMPDDDTLEPLPDEIDMTDVFTEALALAVPLYPRAEAAKLEQAAFTEPGKTPMTDEDARPFATLAGLKRRLEDDSQDDDGAE